ncbi:hypothetical protein A9W99_17245, partial [Mycobacterium sp. 1164966.3]|uniref:DUF7159 family protein n=1 Tax=Mycobacterium sp. 1164966.3 TaxID=1856861 RepID=UPI0008018A66
REGAAEGGYQLASTGVTWTDPTEAAVLRDTLAAHKIENVMLVSSFLAAAALAHSVGNETNYGHTALLYIEPSSATLAVVDTADGSIADIRRHALPEDDDAAVAELASMVSSAENLSTRPDGVFVVGSGIDIPLIKPALEAATSLPLSAPEEPETALARGAALASASAPLFSSSTAAVAYAQDPGTGAVNPFLLDAAYFDAPAAGTVSADALAYSAVPDEPFTGEHAPLTGVVDPPERKKFALIGSAAAAIFVVGVAALVVSLALSIRPTAGVRPAPDQNIVAPPTQSVPAAPAPAPQSPAPEPKAPAPAPVPQAPVPAPQAPAPAPVPVPQAPAPAPVPVPVPVPELPPIFNPPGPGGGGFPGNGHGGGEGRGGGDGPRGGGGGIPGLGGGGFPGGGGGGGHGGGGGGGGHGGGHGGGRGFFGVPGIPGL